MAGKKFKIGTSLATAQDTNRVRRVTADLTAYCGLLKNLCTDLFNAGFVGAELTQDEQEAVLMLDASGIISKVKAEYEKQLSQISGTMIRAQLQRDGLNRITEDIKKIFKAYTGLINKPFSVYMLDASERARFISYQAGKWICDIAKAETSIIPTITSQEQADILNRASEILADLNELEIRVNKVSRGYLHFVAFGGDSDRCIIQIAENGKYYLNVENAVCID